MTNPYQDPGVKKLLAAAMGLHGGAHVDLSSRVSQDKPMADITREELDAKLETIEVRMDARVASIEGKIDSFMARLDERFLRTDESMSRIEQDISEVKTDSKNLKFWLAGTAVAVFLGIAGVNVALLQTMLASFESGKNISTAQAEVRRQSEETSALLKQLQQTYPPPSAPTTPK